ncbi:hypothetical protein M422DRAFT_262351 [Sphaerobolus stellatus SS14]|uniref:Uncharacterized protein n=1 Tax=Sphaerobolus stellatus (strain SS14) TaxID=990650 RepID=A0A0C9UKM8_SPHS4|nr:hypothetical protein M422DRAFT_262351 [Sphaerobolus stellatus SS14]
MKETTLDTATRTSSPSDPTAYLQASRTSQSILPFHPYAHLRLLTWDSTIWNVLVLSHLHLHLHLHHNDSSLIRHTRSSPSQQPLSDPIPTRSPFFSLPKPAFPSPLIPPSSPMASPPPTPKTKSNAVPNATSNRLMHLKLEDDEKTFVTSTTCTWCTHTRGRMSEPTGCPMTTSTRALLHLASVEAYLVMAKEVRRKLTANVGAKKKILN